MKLKTLSEIKGTWYIKGFTNDKLDAVVATPEEVEGTTIMATLTDMRISKSVEISSAKKEGDKWCIEDILGIIKTFELEPKVARVRNLVFYNATKERSWESPEKIIEEINGGDRTYQFMELALPWVPAIITSCLVKVWVEDGKINAITESGSHYISTHYNI